jgi:hypothetical protein
MADSVTGVPVYLLADLATAGAGANVLGADTDRDAASVVVRDRWNQRAVVAVSDHPADGGDGNERALFVSEGLNHPWILGGAKLGTYDVNDTAGAVDGTDIVIPE